MLNIWLYKRYIVAGMLYTVPEKKNGSSDEPQCNQLQCLLTKLQFVITHDKVEKKHTAMHVGLAIGC